LKNHLSHDMSFLRKLIPWKLPRLEPEPAAPPLEPEIPATFKQFGAESEWAERHSLAKADPRDEPAWVVNQLGHEQAISKLDWQRYVLPESLKKAWDNPDLLAAVVGMALMYKCGVNTLKGAWRLAEIDSDQRRAMRLLGNALLHSGNGPEAQQRLQVFIEHNGEDAGLLATLGKAQLGNDQTDDAEKSFWRSLELNPNEWTAVLWYVGIHFEARGPDGEKEALNKIAALPGSWRAQSALGWPLLVENNIEGALGHYADSISKAPRPVPQGLLLSISNALLNHEYLLEMLQLVGPVFSASEHGILVGSNLIKAQLNLGQLDAATRLVEALRNEKQTTWDEALNYWEVEIVRKRREIADAIQLTRADVGYIRFAGPIWLDPDSPAAELFPAKSKDAPVISFLIHTATLSEEVEQTPEKRNSISAFSSAVPLHLAEHVEFHTVARTLTLVPWARQAGLVREHGPYADEVAAKIARTAPIKIDFVVTGHIQAKGELWPSELRLVRVSDGKLMGTASSEFEMFRPQNACFEFAKNLTTLITSAISAAPISPPDEYRVPNDGFWWYLAALHTLFLLRCVDVCPVSNDFWIGERKGVEHVLELCHTYPRNVIVRILVAQIALALRRARPKVAEDFKDRLLSFHKENSLPEPLNGVLQRVFNEAFAVSDS
jgi:tetratricopeptide (TPR) repeat protein